MTSSDGVCNKLNFYTYTLRVYGEGALTRNERIGSLDCELEWGKREEWKD